MSMTDVGVFLVFGAGMCGLAGTTLVSQGTTLDKVWDLNPIKNRLDSDRAEGWLASLLKPLHCASNCAPHLPLLCHTT